jgi:hypothetical protein
MATNNKRKKERIKKGAKEERQENLRCTWHAWARFFFGFAIKGQNFASTCTAPYSYGSAAAACVQCQEEADRRMRFKGRYKQLLTFHLIAHWFPIEARVPFHRPAVFSFRGKGHGSISASCFFGCCGRR